VVVTPTDGESDGPSAEAEVTVNTPPTQPVVGIRPDSPVSGQTLICDADSTDVDGDYLRYSYQWYKDDVLQPDQTVRRVFSEFTASGETWRVVVTPSDGREEGPPGEAGVTIDSKSPSGSVVVSSLAAMPTALGAQLSFTLSAEGSVNAEVLNIAGRPVRLLVSDRTMPAGVSTLTWDGRNASGLQVPSGLYLLRLTANGDGGSRSEAIATVQLKR